MFRTLAPGMLLAATGVGSGDLIASTLAGSEAGIAVLWAVAVGAILKYALTEGIARWQLATGTTVLEGWSWKLGAWIRWVFIVYILLFTLIVGRALISACGVAGTGFYPLSEDLSQSVFYWGLIHTVVGGLMVLYGAFAFFEVFMSVLVGIMFVTVISTAVIVSPDWATVAAGFIPSMPETGSQWVLGVIGGVGGTVTLLSYGYWIQEQGRQGLEEVKPCRLDLAVGNGVTAIFGIAVVVIGSQIELREGGSMLALVMAEKLAEAVGPAGKWAFLVGFWGAVFSSLLGVWQSIPYLFADFVDLQKRERSNVRHGRDLRKTKAYRGYVVWIALAPLPFLNASVRDILLVYSVFGACFLPLLAFTLLLMNNRRRWVGSDFLTPRWLNAVLACSVVFFLYLGFFES